MELGLALALGKLYRAFGIALLLPFWLLFAWMYVFLFTKGGNTFCPCSPAAAARFGGHTWTVRGSFYDDSMQLPHIFRDSRILHPAGACLARDMHELAQEQQVPRTQKGLLVLSDADSCLGLPWVSLFSNPLI